MAENAIAVPTLLIFDVGAVSYAVDIHAVREILRAAPVEALPSHHAFVVGAFEHRGEVLPVIDLRMRFGLGATVPGRDTRFVVAQQSTHAVVLIADRVREVWRADPAQERALPEPLDHALRGARSAYSVRGRLVFVVDAGVLTSVQEWPLARGDGEKTSLVP